MDLEKEMFFILLLFLHYKANSTEISIDNKMDLECQNLELMIMPFQKCSLLSVYLFKGHNMYFFYAKVIVSNHCYNSVTRNGENGTQLHCVSGVPVNES